MASQALGRERRPKPKGDIIDVKGLIRDLNPLVNRVVGKQDISFQKYGKRRGLSADVEGLYMYRLSMALVLRHAPQGLPAHSQLQEVIASLNKTYHLNVRSDTGKLDVQFERDAADVWKTMCTQMRNMKLTPPRYPTVRNNTPSTPSPNRGGWMGYAP